MSGATDSPRWCETCNGYGDHHTDRHPMTGDLTETLTAVLVEHDNCYGDRNGDVFVWSCGCGFVLDSADDDDAAHMKHRTAVLAALVAAEREKAVEAATRKWQMGGWTVLTEALKTEGIPALAAGQAVTDWFRTYAAEIHTVATEGGDR